MVCCFCVCVCRSLHMDVCRAHGLLMVCGFLFFAPALPAQSSVLSSQLSDQHRQTSDGGDVETEAVPSEADQVAVRRFEGSGGKVHPLFGGSEQTSIAMFRGGPPLDPSGRFDHTQRLGLVYVVQLRVQTDGFAHFGKLGKTSQNFPISSSGQSIHLNSAKQTETDGGPTKS